MIDTLNDVEPILSPTPTRTFHPPAGGIRLPACFGFRVTNAKCILYAVITNAFGWPVDRVTVRDGTWYPRRTGRWWLEAVGALGGDASALAVDVEYATSAKDLPPATAPGSVAAPVTVTLSSGNVQVAADPTLAKVYGTPVVGGSGAIVLGAGNQQVATVAGRMLQLTAVDGDAFYAIDGDSTVAANKILLQAGATAMVKAGAALHASQGPNAGGTLYFAQLV